MLQGWHCSLTAHRSGSRKPWEAKCRSLQHPHATPMLRPCYACLLPPGENCIELASLLYARRRGCTYLQLHSQQRRCSNDAGRIVSSPGLWHLIQRLHRVPKAAVAATWPQHGHDFLPLAHLPTVERSADLRLFRMVHLSSAIPTEVQSGACAPALFKEHSRENGPKPSEVQGKLSALVDSYLRPVLVVDLAWREVI